MATEVTVEKESGEREPFNAKKVADALKRAGLTDKSIKEAITELEPRLYEGIPTKEIYSVLFRIIEKTRPEASHKYNLKRALVELGPAGYEFEDFTSRLLNLEGYKTEVRQMLEGKCVSHEIDVVAEKGKDSYMVECKFHNSGGIKCRIQVALYAYARFLDLVEGAKLGKCKKFTKPYLVCNTKFSGDAIDYATCMGIPLLGWHYPFERGLERMIEDLKCWPVTVIPMTRNVAVKLFERKIIVVSDLPESASKLVDLTGISFPTAKIIIEKAEYAR